MGLGSSRRSPKAPTARSTASPTQEPEAAEPVQIAIAHRVDDEGRLFSDDAQSIFNKKQNLSDPSQKSEIDQKSVDESAEADANPPAEPKELSHVEKLEQLTARKEFMEIFRGRLEERKEDAKALGKFIEDMGKALFLR